MNWINIGINYKKANLSERQKYSLTEDQIIECYALFRQANINNALVLSTCNRTEFFIPKSTKENAIALILDHFYSVDPDESLFHYNSETEAGQYFFRICSGLESQITGDFEILGQVRKASILAKKHGMITGVWEKTINSGLHAAKRARTETAFYSGAISTSYASIEYLRKTDLDFTLANFLIIGTGKIGSHTLGHLLKTVKPNQITICNRSQEKAIKIAAQYHLKHIAFEELTTKATEYNVIICATNATEYIITPAMLDQNSPMKIIDLAVPLNVDPILNENELISVVNVDQLSKMINKNLEKRVADITKVEAIINDELENLNAWHTIKTGMPLLSEIKEELEQIKKETLSKMETPEDRSNSDFLDEYTDELFNQLSYQWIKKVRNQAANAGIR